ncbi:MAG: peptidylprolyl isomerase [Anaerolineae bacterium]|nr:peptidylprolyl isomerase [Anaerolineae bacterium]
MAKRPAQKSGLTRRQVSRIERERRAQRAILIGVGVVAAAVIGLISYSILNEKVFKPNRPVVTINGKEVSVSDFQDRVKFEYYFQYGYQPTADVGTSAQIFGQTVLDSIIREELIKEKADELGITVTEEEAVEQLELAVGFDSGDPEPTFTPWPTSVENDMTPTASPTFVYTRTPRPTNTLEPGVTPTLTATPTQTPSGPTEVPTITLTPTATVTPIPMSEEVYTETLDSFLEEASAATGLEIERIRELLIDWAGATYRERLVTEAMEYDIDETKTMLLASHILVETEEEAQAVLDRLAAGEEFETIAAEVSIDASTAYRGGDLGWFGRGQMVEPFEEAAFALDVGEVSEPVQSDYGWHIIKLYDRDDEYPTLYYEQLQQRSDLFEATVLQWQINADIEYIPNLASYIPDLP